MVCDKSYVGVRGAVLVCAYHDMHASYIISLVLFLVVYRQDVTNGVHVNVL